MVADIKSERWPASRRNGWPASVGIRNERDLVLCEVAELESAVSCDGEEARAKLHDLVCSAPAGLLRIDQSALGLDVKLILLPHLDDRLGCPCVVEAERLVADVDAPGRQGSLEPEWRRDVLRQWPGSQRLGQHRRDEPSVRRFPNSERQ
ncbi:MAG: hypothetical protein K2Y56_17130, partial [Methylobacterium sp.]|uniref:hypothetical protein n=1 Tax=Methylobacterium sp. TaxID=409 RepID=UPI0025F5F20E